MPGTGVATAGVEVGVIDAGVVGVGAAVVGGGAVDREQAVSAAVTRQAPATSAVAVLTIFSSLAPVARRLAAVLPRF
jgi:hypothetical protein